MQPSDNCSRKMDGCYDAPLSWCALLASLGINALVWSTLWLLYQQATEDMARVELRRTPIVWLPSAAPAPSLPDASASDDSAVPQRVASGLKALAPSTLQTSQVSGRDAVSSADQTSRPVAGSDRWYPDPQNGDAGSASGDGMQLPADPLQLRRPSPMPASISRLQLRMRSAGGLASSAQLKVCGALLRQWEGMRLDAAKEQVPLGLSQPAGRQTIWHSLQAEGCLD